MKAAQLLALSTLFVALTACFGSNDEATDANEDSDETECTEDTQRCAEDDSAVEQCVDGFWQTWTDCDDGCTMSEGEPSCDDTVAG